MAYMELYSVSDCEKHNYFGSRTVMELASMSLISKQHLETCYAQIVIALNTGNMNLQIASIN